MRAEPGGSLRDMIARAVEAYELAQVVRLHIAQTVEERQPNRVDEAETVVQVEPRRLALQRRQHARQVAAAEQERSAQVVESMEALDRTAHLLLERASIATIVGAPLLPTDEVAPARRADEEVAAAFAAVQGAHADLRVALLRLGQSLAATGQWDLARRAIESLLDGPPGPLVATARALFCESYYVAALKLMGNGDWLAARKAVQMVLGIDPGYKEAQAMLRATHVQAARRASDRGRWEEAQEQLTSWLAQHRDDTEVRDLACETYRHLIHDALERTWVEQAARLVAAARAIYPQWAELRALLDANPSLHWAGGTVAIAQQSEPLDKAALAVDLSPNWQSIAAGGTDKRVKVWEVATATIEHNLWEHFGEVDAVGYSNDGQWLASGSVDRSLSLWALPSGEVRRKFKGHRGAVRCLVISPDSRWLASGSADRTVRVWEIESGKLRHVLSGHGGTVSSLSFSPDGTMLASGAADATIKLWDLGTGQTRVTLTGHVGGVACLAFSSDGRLLASGGEDRTVRLWEPASGTPCGRLEGHRQRVTGLAFSPDSQLLASCSLDNSVRLWGLREGAALHTLDGLSGPGASLRFAPDGGMLACADLDLAVCIWTASL